MTRASRTLNPPSAEAHQAALAALDEGFARYPIASKPLLAWKRFTVTAGMAYYRENVIGLSRHVKMSPDQIRETVLHEYAHLLAVHRHGPLAANHGPHWKQAMKDLGLAPKVRHTYEVSRSAPRLLWVYRCERCGILIQRRRRLASHRKYAHSGCGGLVQLTGPLHPTSP